MNETTYNFNAGMSLVVSPDLLAGDMAREIADMTLEKDGSWTGIGKIMPFRDIRFPEYIPEHLFMWKPAEMPIYANQDPSIPQYVFIAFVNENGRGEIHIWYFVGDNRIELKNIGEYTLGNAVRAASNAVMFVFVDGRTGLPAQRITIDDEGEAVCKIMGIAAPTDLPQLLDIVTDFADNLGTGATRGSAMIYAYTYLNRYGEKSNPSPQFVIDSYQWQGKGSFPGKDDYIYGDRTGSIKSVKLSIPIAADPDITGVELYRGMCEYNESNYPLDGLKLVAIKTINPGSTNIVINDSTFGTGTDISYNNDQSPKGDDIAMISGTTFIANANPTLAVWNAEIHRVTISNNNDSNFVNQWFRIDFHDKESRKAGYGNLGFVWDDIDFGKVRLLANDMSTNLMFYYYPFDDLLWNPMTGQYYVGRLMSWVRIPYVPAYSETDIYLCIFRDDPPENFPRPTRLSYDLGDSWDDFLKLYDNGIIQCPVRNQHHLISQNKQRGIELPYPVLAKINPMANKANEFFESEPTITGDGQGPFLFDERVCMVKGLNPGLDINFQSNVPTNIDHDDDDMYVYSAKSVLMPSKGWASFYHNLYKLSDIPLGTHLFLAKSGAKRMISVICHSINGTFTINVGCAYTENFAGPPWVYTELLSRNSLIITHIEFYLYLTWDYQYKRNGGDLFVKPYLMFREYNGDTETWSNILFIEGERIAFSRTDIITFEGATISYRAKMNGGELISSGNFNFSASGYYPERHQFMSAVRNLPIFDTEQIGAYGAIHLDENGVRRCYNENIVFRKVQDQVTKEQVGKIFWGSYSRMSNINFQNLLEEIIRILPEKSYSPTEQHNTLVIFTASGKHRMALFNDGNTNIVTDHNHIGLANPDALSAVPGGMVWLDARLGLFIERYGEIQNISNQYVDISKEFEVYYDSAKNWVWVGLFYTNPGGGEDPYYSTVYIYNLNNGTWSLSHQRMIPKLQIDYISGNEPFMLYINPVATGYFYYYDKTMNNYEPYIITRAFIDRKKIRRIMLRGAGNENATIHIYSSEDTPSPPVRYIFADVNKRYGTPGIKSPWVYFLLACFKIKGFMIERID